MAADKFNSLTGYSVGIPAVDVIDSNGNVISNFLNLSGNVSANKVYANSFFYANGQPFNANPGGSNTQLQFNNNGALGGIPNVTWNGSILSLGTVTALSIGGGDNGYFLQTDGVGNLTWAAAGGGGGNGSPGGANTQVQFNDAGTFGGDVGFTYDKNTNTLHVDNIAAGPSSGNTINTLGSISAVGNVTAGNIVSLGNVTGDYLFGNGYYVSGLTIDVANYVSQPNQANITGLGNLLVLNVDGNINGLGDIRTSGDFSGGNISLSGTVTAPNATFSNKVIIGSNLTVNSSAVLRVSGNLNAAGSPNIALGTLANIHITGGSGGQVLSTDGTGNLYWATGSGGGNGTPGGNNQSVQFNSGGDFGGDNTFVYDTGTGKLTVPQIRSNNTANFQGATSVNLGIVGNLHIAGGTSGQVLSTDGSGNLSWSTGGGGNGGGTPGGANTYVQFNNSGDFGGSAYLTYNDYTRVFQVGGNLVANSVQMGAGAYKWSTSQVYFATTASATPAQVLYAIPVADISGVEFEIISTEPAGPSRQFCKISSLYYNGTVQFNEYASLFVNGGVGNFEVDYDAGNIIVPPSLELKVTPNTSNPVTYKMLITVFAG